MRALLRPVTSADGGFLFDLYGTTWGEDTVPRGWGPEAVATFLRIQFDAQRRHYARHFPEAGHSIIELEGRPVGRLYVHQTEDAVRVVDISLLPGHRGAGIGTSILKNLLTSAHAAGKPVRLRVAKLNPAQRLYLRLGFVVAGDTGPHVEMEALNSATQRRSNAAGLSPRAASPRGAGL